MQIEVGSVVQGKVTGIMSFGAFVALEGGVSGLVHISEVANTYVADINQFLEIGQEVKVKVVSIDPNGKMSLSIKKAEEGAETSAPAGHKPSGRSYGGNRAKKEPLDPFEEMMKRFKQSSEEKMHDLKKKDKRS